MDFRETGWNSADPKDYVRLPQAMALSAEPENAVWPVSPLETLSFDAI